MQKTIEVIIEKDGTVRLLEPVYPEQTMRALLTLIEPVIPVSTQDETAKLSVWDALQVFLNSVDLASMDLDTSLFDRDRKQEKERDVNLRSLLLT